MISVELEPQANLVIIEVNLQKPLSYQFFNLSSQDYWFWQKKKKEEKKKVGQVDF